MEGSGVGTGDCLQGFASVVLIVAAEDACPPAWSSIGVWHGWLSVFLTRSAKAVLHVLHRAALLWLLWRDTFSQGQPPFCKYKSCPWIWVASSSPSYWKHKSKRGEYRASNARHMCTTCQTSLQTSSLLTEREMVSASSVKPMGIFPLASQRKRKKGFKVISTKLEGMIAMKCCASELDSCWLWHAIRRGTCCFRTTTIYPPKSVIASQTVPLISFKLFL